MLRVLIIISFIATSIVYYIKLGSLRIMLSTCVTFSNQVVLMMVGWTVLSLIWSKNKYLDISFGMIKSYGLVISIVFYCFIIPYTAYKTPIKTIVLDALIHIIIPTIFQLQKRTTTKIPFMYLMIYPVIYFVFIHFISYRRGYLIYPFLNNVPILLVIVFIFYFSHEIQ